MSGCGPRAPTIRGGGVIKDYLPIPVCLLGDAHARTACAMGAQGAASVSCRPGEASAPSMRAGLPGG
jgi:hypothetical protein